MSFLFFAFLLDWMNGCKTRKSPLIEKWAENESERQICIWQGGSGGGGDKAGNKSAIEFRYL